MRFAPHIFLLLIVASCGGSSANRSEVAQLRADVRAMEIRLQEAEEKKQKQLVADDAALGPAPDMNRKPTVAEIFAGIAERVCMCDDMECVEKEARAMDALKNEEEPGPAEMKAIMADMEKLSDCVAKLTAAAVDAAAAP